MKKTIIIIFAVAYAVSLNAQVESDKNISKKIDRHALVTRHNPSFEVIDSLGVLTVGNGNFAFTVDATGLQTFPEYHEKGIRLGTQSNWG